MYSMHNVKWDVPCVVLLCMSGRYDLLNNVRIHIAFPTIEGYIAIPFANCYIVIPSIGDCIVLPSTEDCFMFRLLVSFILLIVLPCTFYLRICSKHIE